MFTEDSLPPEFHTIFDFCDLCFSIDQSNLPRIQEMIKEVIEKSILTIYQILSIVDCVLMCKIHDRNGTLRFVHKLLDLYEFDFSKVTEIQYPFLFLALIQFQKINAESEIVADLETGPLTEADLRSIDETGSLGNSIKNDDLDKLIEYSADPKFSVEQRIFQNSLLELAALYGSLNCFKFLQVKGAKFTEKTVMNSIKSDNYEIFHIAEQNVKINKKMLDEAILQHNDPIINYIIDKYSINYSYSACAKSFNFKYLFNKLIQSGDINNFDSPDGNCLLCLCGTCFDMFVKFLCEHGADANIFDSQGHTPIYYATEYCESKNMKILIEHGADIFKAKYEDNQMNILMKACKSNDLEVVKTIMDCKDRPEFYKFLKETDIDGKTSLHFAIGSGNIEIIDLLIDSGLDINCADRAKCTPFMVACHIHGNDINLLKHLIEKGADIHKKDHIGCTCLSYLVDEEQLEGLKFLVEQGADINVRNQLGTTPLLKVADTNNTEIAKYLIEKGANVNYTGYKGISPLMKASKHNCLGTIKLLLEHGADRYKTNDEGMNCLEFAISANSYDAVKLLLENGIDPNKGRSPLLMACANNYTEIIQLLIDHGCKIDTIHENGIQPLTMAIFMRQYEAVKVLVENGADFDIRYNGEPMVLMALRVQDPLIAAYLVRKGANINYYFEKMNFVVYCIVHKIFPVLDAISETYPELWNEIIGKTAN
ncbi:hypothetical protein TVAG_284550 [Trichomonas vaginalis G3]|uniref:DUF3447 domain-containing protein n=1 Tax=Trichomonas vaginalis (strain ATCC PRA-98 / G3) TaxID=412133 RepID=A2ENB3_TRIV3|nr:spectrin binding [Trichomonas vaginalis G3]EAY05872.1 hypothetical protein TVAG_284550 [Trichomonas vaginalis G3]KAI5531681.1 spectrin binding [Trichomonas vaginalis G3]|eukprot:XP_001318095.1 hypothetical protein [Trichomonas vaginalis G3]